MEKERRPLACEFTWQVKEAFLKEKTYLLHYH